MVYRKSNITVLLGPERFRNVDTTDECGTSNSAADTTEERYPARVGIRRPLDSHVFETIGESKVYKRTRPFQSLHGRPKIERYPSGLTLEGQKVESEDTKLTAKSAGSKTTAGESEELNIGNSDSDRTSHNGGTKMPISSRDLPSAGSRYSPSVQRPKRERGHSGNNPQTVSRNFLTEFGLRTDRSDTFSGHQRRRGASADMERQLEMSAERHIRTCQVVGNLKRGSKAQQSYQGLLETVYPLNLSGVKHSTGKIRSRYNNTNLLKEKSFFKSEPNLANNKSELTLPYMIQLRRNVGSTPRIQSLGKPFSAREAGMGVNSRTLIVGTGVQLS